MNSVAAHPPKTLKQKTWAKFYLATGNATEAAVAAYDCVDRASAAVVGSKNLNKLNLTELLDESGLSDIELVKGLKEATEAKKLFIANGSRYWITDHSIRLQAITLALKLKNKFPRSTDPSPEQQQHGQRMIEELKNSLGIDQDSLDAK